VALPAGTPTAHGSARATAGRQPHGATGRSTSAAPGRSRTEALLTDPQPTTARTAGRKESQDISPVEPSVPAVAGSFRPSILSELTVSYIANLLML
jgi:hypothetical protein